jgi:hypothetical protein
MIRSEISQLNSQKLLYYGRANNLKSMSSISFSTLMTAHRALVDGQFHSASSACFSLILNRSFFARSRLIYSPVVMIYQSLGVLKKSTNSTTSTIIIGVSSIGSQFIVKRMLQELPSELASALPELILRDVSLPDQLFPFRSLSSP